VERAAMKNIYEVLKQKEAQIQQIQKEIEALKIAARLLADDGEIERPVSPVIAGTPLASVSRVASSRENGGQTAWDSTTKQFP
jgi:hypothetical protein